MSISSFDGLLQAARQQTEPQRLLLVFVHAELPDDATREQRERFSPGEGGALAPIMCVDKAPDEPASFALLVNESAAMGQPWVMVFAAGTSGSSSRAPTSADAQAPLQRMADAIKAGRRGNYPLFDREGVPVELS
jgi:hypothetical protein